MIYPHREIYFTCVFVTQQLAIYFLQNPCMKEDTLFNNENLECATCNLCRTVDPEFKSQQAIRGCNTRGDSEESTELRWKASKPGWIAGGPSWLWNPSPEIQNRGTSGPTKKSVECSRPLHEQAHWFHYAMHPVYALSKLLDLELLSQFWFVFFFLN